MARKGGKYIDTGDGQIVRVEGPGMTKDEKKAAQKAIKKHADIQENMKAKLEAENAVGGTKTDNEVK